MNVTDSQDMWVSFCQISYGAKSQDSMLFKYSCDNLRYKLLWSGWL